MEAVRFQIAIFYSLAKMFNSKTKLPQVSTTIFTVMSQLANQHRAINLAQGFPGFDCSDELKSLVTKYLQQGHNQYAPMHGVAKLREALAHKAKEIYGVGYDSESEITIVSGATEAIFNAITCAVHPGDEVIIMEPAYDSYVPAVNLSGGIPVFVRLNPADFSVNWEAVKQAITPKTKMMVVNTPHNPTGFVWTADDLVQLEKLVSGTEILMVSDEVYEHITFDGQKHLSLMTNPELQRRTFICGSFGKTYHVTGWKIGYCLAPALLTKEFRKVHQYVTFSTATPLQYALAEYLENPIHYLELSAFYQRKRDVFCQGLASTRFHFKPAQGSFFQMVQYGHFSGENDFDIATRLISEVGVAAIPVSAFYHDKTDLKMLRFCFAKTDEELERAIALLEKLD